MRQISAMEAQPKSGGVRAVAVSVEISPEIVEVGSIGVAVGLRWFDECFDLFLSNIENDENDRIDMIKMGTFRD